MVIVSLLITVPVAALIYYFFYLFLPFAKEIQFLAGTGVSLLMWMAVEYCIALKMRKSHQLLLKE